MYIIVEGWGNEAGTYILNLDNNYVNTVVGTDIPFAKEQQLKIFPNPTRDRIYIEGIIPEQIFLYTINGKLIQSFSDYSNSIDLSELSKGMYILDLIFEGEHLREKIIKE